MAKARGDIQVGNPDPPKPDATPKPDPKVEVTQTVDVKNLEALIKEKMTDFQTSLTSIIPGSAEVSTKLQEILDWMQKEKPATLPEVIKKVEETVSPSLLSRIPASITLMGKPIHNLFFKGKSNGKDETE